jgi:hypothetical protein
VHFEIPIINKAGRGLPFTYTLTYDSSVWYPAASGSNTVWTPVSNWGWRAVTAAETGYVSWTVTNASCQCYECSTYYWSVYSNWQYHDPLGAVHPFSLATVGSWQSGWPCGGGPPNSASNISADDGSGYQISTSIPAGSYQQTPSFSLKAKNGATINAPGQVGTGSGSLTDRNGNYISVASSTQTTFTDTLGTTALTVFGGGVNPEVLAYPNPGGSTLCTKSGAPSGTSCYVINYSTYTVQTSFGCSGITDYPATHPAHRRHHQLCLHRRLLRNHLRRRHRGHLSRTTPDSSTAWVYVHAESAAPPDRLGVPRSQIPQATRPSISFQPDAPSGGQTNGYEVQRKAYQGASTLLCRPWIPAITARPRRARQWPFVPAALRSPPASHPAATPFRPIRPPPIMATRSHWTFTNTTTATGPRAPSAENGHRLRCRAHQQHREHAQFGIRLQRRQALIAQTNYSTTNRRDHHLRHAAAHHGDRLARQPHHGRT